MLDKFLTLKIGDFGFARAGDQVKPLNPKTRA
jgi:hypothetical protein